MDSPPHEATTSVVSTSTSPAPPSGHEGHSSAHPGQPFVHPNESNTNLSNSGANKSRLDAFSDGVFSIVITLLVLGLNVPEGLRSDQVWEALLKQLPHLGAYLLSFFAVGVFWVAHNVMLHAVAYVDRPLLWLNNLFLMTMTFIPFSANVLGNYSTVQVAVALYGLNMALVEVFLFSFWFYISYKGRLLRKDINPKMAYVGYRRVGTGLLIYVLGCGLAFVLPAKVSITLYWLVPLSFIYLQTVQDRKIDVRRT